MIRKILENPGGILTKCIISQDGLRCTLLNHVSPTLPSETEEKVTPPPENQY